MMKGDMQCFLCLEPVGVFHETSRGNLTELTCPYTMCLLRKVGEYGVLCLGDTIFVAPGIQLLVDNEKVLNHMLRP